ncbi:MAG: DUF1240 domain-containing protein [Bacteroidaceae bacterium]|nr:DUF1240 domain-containing protein [Bacteroidaceae bacterium]
MAVFIILGCIIDPIVVNIHFISNNIKTTKYLLGVVMIVPLYFYYRKHKNRIIEKYKYSKYNKLPSYVFLIIIFVSMFLSIFLTIIINKSLKAHGYSCIEEMIGQLFI